MRFCASRMNQNCSLLHVFQQPLRYLVNIFRGKHSRAGRCSILQILKKILLRIVHRTLRRSVNNSTVAKRMRFSELSTLMAGRNYDAYFYGRTNISSGLYDTSWIVDEGHGRSYKRRRFLQSFFRERWSYISLNILADIKRTKLKARRRGSRKTSLFERRVTR